MKLTQAEYLPWFQKIVQKILKFLDEMQKKNKRLTWMLQDAV